MLDSAPLHSVFEPIAPVFMLARERAQAFEAGPRAARRWASFILMASDASDDPRTLEEWGRAVGVSRSVLVESSARLGVSPRDARDLARVLRLVRRVDDPWAPDLALAVADRRTLRALLDRAGLNGAATRARPTPEEFLLRQRFVPQTSPGLGALRHLLGRAAHVTH
jgi:hypothetical protein